MDTEQRTRPSGRSMAFIAVFVIAALAIGLLIRLPARTANTASDGGMGGMGAMSDTGTANATSGSEAQTEEAIFAGGCFWCIEAAFELMPGVTEAISGYTGGHVENPTYEQVITGTTGHYEAVLVRFDPVQITYEQLLDQFWRSVNPTDGGGQFYDRGSQYYTAIFYKDEEQQALAEASKVALEASGIFDKPIVTQILPAQIFYVAEDYHQDYSQKYLAQYKAYSKASGRDDYLEQTWEAEEE